MKKNTMLLLALSMVSLSGFAQSARWFVSAASGYPFGGPFKSMKNNMKKSGLDQTSTADVLFLSFTTHYPTGSQNPPLLIKFGKRLTDTRSLYIIAGLSNSGEAEGNKNAGADWNAYPLFGGSTDVVVDVKYSLFQVSAGYQYSFSNTHAKVAVAPSLFLFNYRNINATQRQHYTAFTPGVALTGRVPLGKEKRLFGVDLVAELNLAPPVKMKPLSTAETIDNKTITATLESNSVNMIHGLLGLAFSFRR